MYIHNIYIYVEIPEAALEELSSYSWRDAWNMDVCFAVKFQQLKGQ